MSWASGSIMRGKRAKELRRKAAALITNEKGIQKDMAGIIRWPEGSFRRTYQDLKREYRV